MFGRLKNWWKQRRGRGTRTARAPESIDEIVELLTRSGVATNQEATEWLALFRAEHPAASDVSNAINEFCGFLISGERVTEWQREQLKAGKWKGFYFEDRYLLLEQVGKGAGCRGAGVGGLCQRAISPISRMSPHKSVWLL
jgi:hypothetical protein